MKRAALLLAALMLVLSLCTALAEEWTARDDGAAYGMRALTKMVLPEGLAAIDEANFTVCPLLTQVTLPSTVVYVPDAQVGAMNLRFALAE